LEKLGHHPQIPTFLAHFEQDSCLYLVQEFIDGTNLAEIVEEEGTFNEAQIWQLLDELLPVLKFIHDRQIIHRDIKPENIIRRSTSGLTSPQPGEKSLSPLFREEKASSSAISPRRGEREGWEGGWGVRFSLLRQQYPEVREMKGVMGNRE
ncbi:MAG TPA: protein kinase, partial [Allocoleopsis sp.]